MRTCLPALAVAIAGALALPGGAVADDIVPGQVLVRYEPGSSSGDRASARDDTGTEAIDGLGMPRAQLLKITDGDSVSATVRQLEAQFGVAFAEPNQILHPAGVPNDDFFGLQWGLDNVGQSVGGVQGSPDADIDAPEAWAMTTGDLPDDPPTTVVAVMDSGTDLQHPDLQNEVWTDPGYDFVDNDPDPTDLLGHGTHVAGIALAQGNNGIGVSGVSQHAALMSLRVCDTNENCPNSALIQAINYAADHGARVANGSIAGGGPDTMVTAALASHPDTLYVFAAGNDGANNDAITDLPCDADQGAGYTANNVICVAATNQSDGLAGFSNYGASSVDLGAPGVDILSTSSMIGVFSDDFESNDFASKWTNTGASTWARSSEPSHNGSFGITDSPGGNYAPNTTNQVTSNPVAFPALPAGGSRSCELDYFRERDLGPGDSFQIQVLLDSVVQLTRTFTSSSPWQSVSLPLDSPFDAGGQVQVRLRLTSDGSGEADGVHMDDIKLVCHGSPSDNGYEFLDGTSMATPMVSGAAALLFAHQPSLSAANAKAVLLDSVDQLPSLSGVTVTGGRLNVYRAVAGDFNPASGGGGDSSGSSASGTAAGTVNPRKPNTFFKRKPGKVVRTAKPRAKVVFKFGSSESGSTFRCKLDGAAFKSCAKKLVRHLRPGRHVLKVKAVSAGGAVDPTPAQAKLRVEQVEG